MAKNSENFKNKTKAHKELIKSKKKTITKMLKTYM